MEPSRLRFVVRASAIGGMLGAFAGGWFVARVVTGEGGADAKAAVGLMLAMAGLSLFRIWNAVQPAQPASLD